jgi:hypothetical protein
MRVSRLALVAIALLFVASAVTAGIALREANSADGRCNEETGRGCAPTDCNPERPACQEKQRAERLRRFCAENPRDEKCR